MAVQANKNQAMVLAGCGLGAFFSNYIPGEAGQQVQGGIVTLGAALLLYRAFQQWNPNLTATIESLWNSLADRVGHPNVHVDKGLLDRRWSVSNGNLIGALLVGLAVFQAASYFFSTGPALGVGTVAGLRSLAGYAQPVPTTHPPTHVRRAAPRKVAPFALPPSRGLSALHAAAAADAGAGVGPSVRHGGGGAAAADAEPHVEVLD